MNDKTKKELIEELLELRNRIAELEKSEESHKKTEEALRESEERYKSLFERSLDCVYICDFEGNFIDANKSALDLLGYEYDDITNINFTSLLDKEDLPRAIEKIKQRMEPDCKQEAIELKLCRKDNSYVWIESKSSLIYKDGEPVALQGIARDISKRKKAEADLKKSLKKLRIILSNTVLAMASAVEARDAYTAGHQLRVADIARAIASKMDLSEDEIEGIRVAGSIHDLGKISIPAEILNKPGKLSDIEYMIIQTHSQVGYDILKKIDFPWPVAQIVYQHHERIDGSGYPNGLSGNDILIESKILAVADTVDAMKSHRPWRAALSIDVVLDTISKNSGTIYDSEVADAFMALLKEKGLTLEKSEW